MLELILIIAVVTAAVSGLVTYFRLSRKGAFAPLSIKGAGVGPKTGLSTGAPVPSPPSLEVAGAFHPQRDAFRFLKLHGLGGVPVYDLCFLPGPLTAGALAPLVSTVLLQMHENGDAVGGDVMNFVHHGKILTEAEMLCFVLLALPNNQGHRVVAFVDKLRFFRVTS